MTDQPSRAKIRFSTAARQIRHAAGLTRAQVADLLGVACEDVFAVEAARASAVYGRRFIRRLIVVVGRRILEDEATDPDVWLCELGAAPVQGAA